MYDYTLHSGTGLYLRNTDFAHLHQFKQNNSDIFPKMVQFFPGTIFTQKNELRLANQKLIKPALTSTNMDTSPYKNIAIVGHYGSINFVV